MYILQSYAKIDMLSQSHFCLFFLRGEVSSLTKGSENYVTWQKAQGESIHKALVEVKTGSRTSSRGKQLWVTPGTQGAIGSLKLRCT